MLNRCTTKNRWHLCKASGFIVQGFIYLLSVNTDLLPFYRKDYSSV